MRRRLVLVLGTGLLVLFGAAGAFTAGALSDRVTEEFDAGLISRLRALRALTEQEGGRIEFDYRPGALPEFERADAPEYFQFWLDDGRPLLRSARMPAGTDLPRLEGAPEEVRRADVVLPDGRPGRLVQVAFTPGAPREGGDDEDAPDPAPAAGPDRGVVLAVARERASLDALLGRMYGVVYGVGAAAAALALLLAWRALARGFRPIEALARQVEALGPDAFHERLPTQGGPREVAPVAERINALLDRLEELYQRERRFTGSVAHELRTPIAELRSLASVAGRWPEDRGATRRFFGDVGEIADRMDGLVADLLLLARCQAGVETARPTRVALAPAVATAWRSLEERAAGAGMTLDTRIAEDLALVADEAKLAIVLRNLLGNAVAHGLPGRRVVCRARPQVGRVALEITNACEPLAPEELARLCEPFWRRDPARTTSEHAGLGLTLVGALAPVLGLVVRFDQPRPGLFRARLEGPAADRAARAVGAGVAPRNS